MTGPGPGVWAKPRDGSAVAAAAAVMRRKSPLFIVGPGDATGARLSPAERLEGDDGVGVLDAGNDLHLLVNEMADVGLVVDVKLDQQVVMAGGGVDLRGDLGLRQRIGHRIRLAELAFELDKEGNH